MSTNQQADKGLKVKTNVEAETRSEPSVIADLPVSDEQAEATKGGVRDLLIFNAAPATSDAGTNSTADTPKHRGITIVAH
jgi:hypothetical protein